MRLLVYIFKIEDRDKLLSLGYTLLRSDERNNIYIFANEEGMESNLIGMDYLYSNTLSF